MESIYLLAIVLQSQWQLVNGTANPTVSNLAYTCTTQVNGTSGTIYVSPGTYNKSYYQAVYGDSNTFAPWPTWLKPISTATDLAYYAWPSYSPYEIPAGKTYQYEVQWTYESGSQTWLGQGHGLVTRSRSWNNLGTVVEGVK